MKAPPAIALALLLAATCPADEPRTWTQRNGSTFSAELLACDALRATLDVAGRGKAIVPLTALSAEDRQWLVQWRRQFPRAPLVDPTFLPKWPDQAAAESFDVKTINEDDGPDTFSWESPHFVIRSDLRLPLGIVRDLAAVFEGTRAALFAVPLGLHAGLENGKYPVRLFSDQAAYGRAGASTGSGGFFNGRETLIFLPNLGIQPSTNGVGAKYTQNLFVLKHEISHQLLRSRLWLAPMWLDEGLAECVASWPYTRGRYGFQGTDTAMHDYLLKWRKADTRKKLTIVAPATLMDLTDKDWGKQVADQSAYDHYNSAALLTHYFMRHDGAGDGANLAAFIAALRAGTPVREAEERHLLRSRTREDLGKELEKLARRMALDVVVE